MTKERILAVLLILVIIFSVNRVLKVNEISNSNEQLYKSVNALNDTIVVKNNKIGEALYEKTTLNLDLNTIKSANSGLKTDIENLSRKDRKNLDRINELSVTISQLRDSLKQGKVSPNISARNKLTQIADVHLLMNSGSSSELRIRTASSCLTIHLI